MLQDHLDITAGRLSSYFSYDWHDKDYARWQMDVFTLSAEMLPRMPFAVCKLANMISGSGPTSHMQAQG
jgi:hypothetical protein